MAEDRAKELKAVDESDKAKVFRENKQLKERVKELEQAFETVGTMA